MSLSGGDKGHYDLILLSETAIKYGDVVDILVIDQQPTALVAWRRLAEQEKLSCEQFAQWDGVESIPDGFVVVLDKTTLRDGLESAVRRVSQASPRTLIIVTCDDLSVDLAMRLMRSGALFVLRKPLEPQQIHQEVAEIRQRLASLKKEKAEFSALSQQFSDLTQRELDVLNYVLQGVSNKNAASSLKVSVRTIEARRAKVYQKTGSSHVVELVRKVDRFRHLSRVFAPHKILGFDLKLEQNAGDPVQEKAEQNWTAPEPSTLRAI